MVAHQPAAPLCVCCHHSGAQPTASLHQSPLCAELCESLPCAPPQPPTPQLPSAFGGPGRWWGVGGAGGWVAELREEEGEGEEGRAGPLQKARGDTVALVTPHPPFFLSSSRCRESFPTYQHISARSEPTGTAETRGSRRDSGLPLSLSRLCRRAVLRWLLSLKGSVRK